MPVKILPRLNKLVESVSWRILKDFLELTIMPIKILPLSMNLIKVINIFQSNIKTVREMERMGYHYSCIEVY